MRKILSIGLILTHLLSGVGVFATVHYCGNTITQWSWMEEETDNCSCEEVKQEDCCSDVRIQSQVIAESTAAQNQKVDRSPIKKLFPVFAKPVYPIAPDYSVHTQTLQLNHVDRPGLTGMIQLMVLRI